MNLRDLKPDLASLTYEQKINLHRDIRQSRRTSKRTVFDRPAKAKKSAKPKVEKQLDAAKIDAELARIRKIMERMT